MLLFFCFVFTVSHVNRHIVSLPHQPAQDGNLPTPSLTHAHTRSSGKLEQVSALVLVAATNWGLNVVFCEHNSFL